MTSTAVRVGLRVRPLTRKEELENCTECITYISNEPQILLGTDKSFTFDYVFNNESEQLHVYNTAAVPLLEKFMDGFNATILAYGQTGSGKTYSMGTGLECALDPTHEGIVPRCMTDLFQRLENRAKNDAKFTYEVYVSFLELYNEDLIDLLSPQQQQQQQQQQHTSAAMKRRSFTASTLPSITEISIREDNEGNIYWSGVREERCYSPEELLGYLSKGSLCRTTAATDMNTVSSRSHAVFSVTLKQPKEEGEPSLISKFHFVDLAGSERLKRTNAQGDRAKEGISINSGLLALGNVISALGDETRRSTHVPYRDSKLTRLLQDSLGGNSQTLMLACVSPADTNFMETLNTLKYANRARNIKNKVSINQEFAGSSIEVNQLRAQIAKLRIELAATRAAASVSVNDPSYNNNYNNNNNNNSSSSSSHSNRTAVYQMMSMHTNTTVHEIEIRSLRSEITQLRERILTLSSDLIQVTSERDTMLVEREITDLLKSEDDGSNVSETAASQPSVQSHPIIQQYQRTIAELNNELLDTRERIAFYENMSSFDLQPSITNSSDVRLSNSLHRLESNLPASTSRRKLNNRRPNSRRHMRHGAASTNSSSRTFRKTTKILAATQRVGDKPRRTVQDEENLDNVEINMSIAKAKEEIQKGMEVLDLMIPTDDSTEAWEADLNDFEKATTEASNSKPADREMERLDSDEGNYTATSSPVDDEHQQQQQTTSEISMDIQALSVPSWDHDTFSLKIKSDSASGDIGASSSSTLDSQIPTDVFNITASNTGGTSNPQFARILHQLQSDIRVKEELVSHLEKSETKFISMRRKFDEKIAQLHAQLAELQRDRDRALAKTKSAYATAAPSANDNNRNDIALQLKEKQQLLETRHAYEIKMKQLVTEIHELKRNYSRMVTNMQSTRNQQESLLRSLRANVESLKTEKRRMVKRMKQETERVREQMALQDRKISKLQRQQTELSHARSKLQKEHEAQKLVLKRRDKEMMISNNQLKQLIEVLKKAVREGGMLDDALLSKVSHILGGNFAAVARRGGMRNLPGYRPQRKRKNPIPVQLRVMRKKQLLDKLLYQFIQGKQAIIEMEQLLFRREQLAAEKMELLEERKSILETEKETSELTGEPMDMLAVDLAEERIDLIDAEISYLSARIRGLQSEAACAADEDSVIQSPDSHQTEQQQHQVFEKRKVTFADDIIANANTNDEWADIDAIEEQYGVPANAAPELVYDGTVKLLKSLEIDECRRIVQSLVDDIASSRMSEYNRQRSMQNLEKTVQDLRKTLIVMKRVAITTSAENERRIRSLESIRAPGLNKSLEKLDEKMEDYIMNSGNTIFDKIYEDGLRGLLNTPEPQYSSNTSPEEALSMTSTSDDRRSSTHSEGLIPPSSPLTMATYTNSAVTALDQLMMTPVRSPTSNGIRPASMLTDKGSMMTRINSNGSYTTRESTPSPDRFYNMIQKRLSWQHRSGNGSNAESSTAMAMANPAEFVRYMYERESSTSSIRSGHLRRTSMQSEFSSSQNSWVSKETIHSSNNNLHQYELPNYSTASTQTQQQQKINRRRSLVIQKAAAATERSGGQQQQQQQQQQHSSLQQQKARRRASLRELSITGIAGSPMGYGENSTNSTSFSSTVSSQQPFSPNADTDRRLLMPTNSSTTMERVSTPNGSNVFHRLAQTPTRASQAKITYRHSSSSMDELKLRWGHETDRISSAASGSYWGDQ